VRSFKYVFYTGVRRHGCAGMQLGACIMPNGIFFILLREFVPCELSIGNYSVIGAISQYWSGGKTMN